VSLDFTNKLVVITGAGRAGQVGEALALGFAQRGATLALLDIDATEVNARASTLTAQGFTASAHAGNLADTDDATRIAAAVIEAHKTFEGAVHAVVCAAGGFGMTGALDSSDAAAWRKQFTINLETAYNATRAFLPAVRKAKGSFVYFGAVPALPGGTGRAWPRTQEPRAVCWRSCARSRLTSARTAFAPMQSRPHRCARRPTSTTWAPTRTTWNASRWPTWWRFSPVPLARNISGQAIKLA
jgi:NAD(P)-dependent dehydrogenase (short-subunit alcohol dehydrogenase family)